MKLFRLLSPTIANKLFFLTVNAVIGIALMTTFLLYQEHNLILQERQNSVKNAVETASSMLEYYEARVKNNEVSLEEAQRRAKNAIKKIRYGEGEHFWINDMTPNMVMHPVKPTLDNTSLADTKDPNGKRLFIEMVDVVTKQGAGSVFYMWPKPGSEAPVEKVSYVKGFAPWGWVVGSGVYLDTINATALQQTKYASLIAALIGGILFAIGLFVARSVSTPIEQAVKVAQKVASGDLSSRIEVTSRDETGKLMQALRDMNENLVHIVSDVHLGTDAIATASGQIAAGNLDLSSRTEMQAGSLEETASAMEQLTATVKQNADHARQANDLAESAADIAERGGHVVAQVVDTMASINASARKVSDITSVIDGIAFQTNILALNAAVEAARAGDQGRGFAVVAGEVRALAQRSATAAKEIRALIDESVHQADSGSQLVQKAGVTMEQIVGSVKQVHDIMMEITAASVEQSHGIEQVNQAIGDMDQVTQQNAALVEEAAAAAGSLQEQAGHLRQLVSVFRLRTDSLTRPQLTMAVN